ncbi:MAG TPA: TolC family protein, partial [Candidatus Dormibacteraeota bacterium]|nr:TolC family protein [Candidatus Dormibacteraeota bacterium]
GYYDLIVAREQLGVQEKALESKKQLVTETRRRVEVGDLPPLDSEQAETQLQNTLTALAAAREELGGRENALKALLTDDFRQWADTTLEPADTLVAVPVSLNRSQSFHEALTSRPDLAEARLAVEKAAVMVQFRYNQLMPNVDLVASYGNQSVQSGISAAVDDAYHFRGPDYTYGLVVSLPLGNLSARSQYRATKSAREMARLQLKKAEQGVFLQVADWVNRVESRFSQVASTRKARVYAEGALAAEEKKWQNGLSTPFFVLQAQEILTAARSAEIVSLAEYNKALAQLAFAEGSLLQKHRVAVQAR